MRSMTTVNSAGKLGSRHAAPHNSSLRIIDSSDEGPVGRRVLVATRGFLDQADVLGLETEGDELAGEALLGLGEGADVRHCRSPCSVSEARPSRSRWRPT